MRRRLLTLSTAVLIALCHGNRTSIALHAAATAPRVSPSRVPALFVSNAGQLDPRVKFYSRASTHAIFATGHALTFAFEPSAGPGRALRLEFANALDTMRIEPLDRTSATINYFPGRVQSQWRTNLPTYQRLIYRGAWPGVDAVVGLEPDRLKYEFRLAAGADPGRIRMRYSGATGLSLDEQGNLRIDLAGRSLLDAAPHAVQHIGGQAVTVAASFVLLGGDEYAIKLGAYDRREPLIIDPSIDYASYLGSSGGDEGHGIAVDASGNAYITGFTQWIDFPTTVGAYQRGLGGNDTNTPKRDAFVTKVSADGASLIYSTYLGGSADDEANAIAIDSAGNAYVAGRARSLDFPVTAGAFQTTLRGGIDAFITKLNPSGSGLVYSTLYGGLAAEDAFGIQVDASGRAYVTGTTQSNNLPATTSGFQPIFGGGFQDGFLIRLGADGTSVEYGTYLGGSNFEFAYGVALRGTDAFVTGQTFSEDFPTTASVDPAGESVLLKTSDAGGTWTRAEGRIRTILSLAQDPANPNIIYAGTDGQAVYKSTTGGSTLSFSGTGIPMGGNPNQRPVVNALLVDRNDSNFVYAATSDGLYKSIDAGAQWTLTSFTGRASDISSNATGTALFAAGSIGSDGGIWKSLDRGTTWTRVLQGPPLAVAAHPFNPGTVFASLFDSLNTGLYRSLDGGTTWTLLNSGGAPGFVRRLRFDPIAGDVFAAGGFGLFKSSNGGATFTELPGFPESVTDVAFDSSTTPATLYVTLGPSDIEAFYKSIDGGATSTPVRPLGSRVKPRALLVTAPGTVLAGLQRLTDAFVTRVNTAVSGGGSLVYSTYASGAGDEIGRAIAVDQFGRAYITGTTTAGDFPNSAPPPSLREGGWLAKLNESGSGWYYLARVGDGDADLSDPRAIAVDGAGNAYVAGLRAGADFVAKYSADIRSVEVLTFGGQRELGANGVALGSDGSVYVTGSTSSTNFPTTAGAFQPSYGSGASDAFIVKARFDGTPEPPGDIVIYAGDIPSSQVHGTWTLTPDATAADGKALSTPDNGFNALNEPLAAPADYVDVTFDAPANTPYAIWLRLRALNDNKLNDAVWVQFSDAMAPPGGGPLIYPIDTTSGLLVNLATDSSAVSLHNWGWQNGAYWLSQTTTVTFGHGGSHTMRIQVREDGVGFDQIVLSPSRYSRSAPGSVTDDHTIVDRSTPPPPPPPPPTLPSPWMNHDVGSVGQAGSATYSGGTFAVAGAGGDIWGAADAFHFVHQPLAGDGEIVVRVDSIQNTHPFAKAGVMMRESLAPDAAYVILDVTPSGVEFMTRAEAGASTSFIAGRSLTAPVWLKLTRAVSIVSAFVSNDGTSWSGVGSTTLSVAGPVEIGMVVCSHDTGTLNHSTFDNVEVITSSPAARDIVIYAADIAAGGIHGSWMPIGDSSAAAGVKLSTPDNTVANTENALASPDDYVDVTFNAPAGTPYTFWLRSRARADSKFNDSVWVQFSDALAGGSPVYPINTSSGLNVNLATDSTGDTLNAWGWQNSAYWLSQPTTFTFSTSGTHTLRIQIREDGVEFDQIVLSPGNYLNAAPGPVGGDHTIVPR